MQDRRQKDVEEANADERVCDSVPGGVSLSFAMLQAQPQLTTEESEASPRSLKSASSQT